MTATTSPRLAVGDTAPAITLPDTTGEVVAIGFAKAKATLVVFTSGGCPYALAWHERIQRLARDYADRGVGLVQIISNDATDRPEDAPEAMARRVAAGEVEGPYLHDPDQAAARAYGATATPEVFVVDANGAVRYHGAPDGDHDDENQNAGWVRAALDQVLAGREVTNPSTSPAGCSIKWRVELLWWDGCPSHPDALALAEDTLEEMSRGDVHVVTREVRRRADAADLGFPGSPTLRVGARDLFPTEAAPALGCRVYPQPDGRLGPLPDRGELESALKDALARPWDLPGWTDFRTKKG